MTTTENTTLEALAVNVQLVDIGPRPSLEWNKQSDWQRKAHGYRLQLRYQGRVYSFDFWQGWAADEKRKPDAVGCLECLLSDSSAIDEDFEGWAADCGYDSDSRKAYAIFLACRRVGRNMRRLLGDDFEAFMYAER